MKKAFKLAWVAMLIASVVGFLALSSDAMAGAKKTITFTHYIRGEEQQTVIGVLQTFMKKYPDLEVKYDFVPEVEHVVKILTLLAAGSPPDVIGMKDVMMPDLADKGALVPLDSYLSAPDSPVDLSDVNPYMLETFAYKGKLYAFPEQFSPNVVYYNKNMLNEVGLPEPNGENWTWDDVLEMSKKLSRDTNSDGKRDKFGFGGVSGRIDNIAYMVWGWGGKIMNADESQWTLYSPETVAAYQFTVDLVAKYNVAPKPEQVGGLNLFALQRVAMVFDNRYIMPLYKTFDWVDRLGMTVTPKGPVDRRNRTSCRAIGIAKGTRNPKEAVMLLGYLTSKEGIGEYMRLARTLTWYKSQLNSREFDEAMLPFENADVYRKAIALWRGSFLPLNWEKVRKLTEDAMAAMIREQVTVDAGVKKLNDDLNKALQERLRG